MKKQLLFICLIFSNLFCHSQSSGTFSGTLTSANSIDTFSFTSSGNGKYLFSGSTSAGGGALTSVTAFIGELNNYNIGGDYDYTNDLLTFESNCVETGQTIGLYIETVGSDISYTINYQFIPSTYSVDNEPNDISSQAISTQENVTYEGWFNNGDQPTGVDNTDWYKFTSPRNGNLTIILNDGEGYAGSNTTLNLFDNLGTFIPSTNESTSGSTTTYTYENFNFNGDDFGIQLLGNCVSYQLSWTIQSTATTTIADSNFEQVLVNLGYDDVVDGSVLTQNIENITTLDISSSNISDLTGIEDFSSLVSFTSIQNPLSTVDFSNNTNLEIISIINNPITNINVNQNTNLTELTVSTQTFSSLESIDVSNLTNLTLLEVGANNLSSLNVSNNTELIYLNFGNNPITDIALSNNAALEFVGAYSTSLTDLDLSNNINLQNVSCYNNPQLETLNLQNGFNNRSTNNTLVLSSLDATNNPNLFCIQVDNVSSAESNPNWQKDAMAVYSVDCAATLSINSNEISNLITLYPIPIKDKLTIDFYEVINNIEIYDILGKKIKSITRPNSSISFDRIISGVYFLKIETDFGTAIKKIIKE